MTSLPTGTGWFRNQGGLTWHRLGRRSHYRCGLRIEPETIEVMWDSDMPGPRLWCPDCQRHPAC